GRAAAAVAKAGGSVAQVEAAGEELAGRVVPSALNVEPHPGRVGGLGDLVGGPVRVPRPGMGRVGGEQVRVIAQLDADGGQVGLDLVRIGRDQGAGVRVDGQPPILMRLGVLANALAAADDVVEGDVDQATVEVEIVDLQAAQLAAAYAGDHH